MPCPCRAARSRSAAWVAAIRIRTWVSVSSALSSGGMLSSAVAISPDATSPASCPPAPSATAQRPRSGRLT